MPRGVPALSSPAQASQRLSGGCSGPTLPAAPGVSPSCGPSCRGAGRSRGGGARFQVVRLRWGAAAAGTAEEERGSQSRRSQRLFGEAAHSEFQETITLVETSFLWPGRVTWLGGDKRQAEPPLWAGSHPASCRHPPRSPEAKGAGGGRAGRQVPAGPPPATHTHLAQAGSRCIVLPSPAPLSVLLPISPPTLLWLVQPPTPIQQMG